MLDSLGYFSPVPVEPKPPQLIQVSWHCGRDLIAGIVITEEPADMKELTAAFQSEVFHPMATLVVPGFFAISAGAVAVWQRFPIIPTWAEQHSGVATTTAVLIVLTCGLVTEDVGARFEDFFDKQLKKKPGFERHHEEWFEYLRIAFDKEPVGHRYLKKLVLRLKFELGMTVAAVPFAGGALCLQAPWAWRIGIFGFALIAFAFFCSEAKSSNKLLSELRRELLKRDWNPSSTASQQNQQPGRLHRSGTRPSGNRPHGRVKVHPATAIES
jgi:hypothetical protein